MPSPYDLVILDLDGTILRHDGTVSPAVAEAIGAVQAAGVLVTIATGRTLDYVRATAAPLGIRTPVVTTQGAVIADPQTGRLLREYTIAAETAHELAAWVDADDRPTALFFNDDEGHTHIAQNRLPAMIADFDHIMGTPRALVGPLLPVLQQPARLPFAAAHAPLKFMMVSDVGTEPELATFLTTRFSPAVTVTRTHTLLIEMTAPGVDKGSGALHLCELLNIDPARTLAMGDHDNDLALFGAVGRAVAVANASDSARAAAHWVAPSIDEDGVAVALRALVMGDAAAAARLLPSLTLPA